MRGIVAQDAAAYSEESLFWPKVRHDEHFKLEVEGLVFGDPNGLTVEEQNHNGDVLRAFAKMHAFHLGLDPPDGDIQVPSFHPMFQMGQDGRLYV